MKSINGFSQKRQSMIQQFSHIAPLQNYLAEKINEGQEFSFVPTMGNLHEGHLSLARESLKDSRNSFCVFSIFVNPKQFGPKEDFHNYPSTIEEDIVKLSSLSKEMKKDILLFYPDNQQEIFPEGFATSITVDGLSKILCGKQRKNHFKGVTTVVYRLLILLKPHRTYMGLKDFQQQFLIKKMVKDLLLSSEIISLPTIREKSNLAMSSRNNYLTPQEREGEALCLYNTMLRVKHALENSSLSLKEKISLFNDEKEKTLGPHSKWQYLELLDSETLKNITSKTKTAQIFGAYLCGKTRLIDNMTIYLNP